MGKTPLFRLIGIFVLLIAAIEVAFSQGTTGSIDITLTDTTGALVPGAAMTAWNTGTGAQFTAQTDASGHALFPLLRAGTYRILVERPGFEKLVRDNIVVNSANAIHLDLRLAVGAVAETVTVAEQTPLLQSEDAIIGHVVEQREITGTPLASRNYTQLLGTSAGIVGTVYNADTPGTGSANFSVNGGRNGSNSLLIDGSPSDNALNNNPGTDGTPSLEFLGEFKVLTHNFGAEYGKALGGIVNVTTRSGSNNLHGGAYEFLRNTDLNARPFFSPKRGQNVQNQFGANLGGPIKRNRTFFFAGWESSRQRNANSGSATFSGVVPTAAQRNGDFGSIKVTDPTTGQLFPNNVIPQSRMNAASVKMQNALFPLPNYGTGTGTNLFVATAIPTDIDQYTARIDHRFGDKDTISGRFFRSLQLTASPFEGGLPGFGTETHTNKSVASFNYTHVFSPGLVLESSFAWDQTDAFKIWLDQTDMKAMGLNPLPSTLSNDGLPYFQISTFFNFGNYQRWTDHVKTGMVREDFTWVKGRHNIKFGGEIRPDLYDDANTLSKRGVWNITGAASGNSYADYLMGYTRTKTFGGGPGRVQNRDWATGFYFSDQWKLSQRITVTMGLRYEPFWQPASYNFAQTNWYPDLYRGVGSLEASGIVQGGVNGIPQSTVYNDQNNFAPRLGVAWRVTDKWVMRAGAGLYFDQRTGQIGQSAFNNPPGFTSTAIDCSVAGALCNLKTPDNWTFVDSGYDPKAIAFPTAANQTVNYVAAERNIKTDNAWQWGYTLQRQVTASTMIEAAYVGTKGTHLMDNYVGNPSIPVGFDPKNPKSGTLVPRYPGFGPNTTVGNGTDSNFNSFQLTAKRRVGSGAIQAAYTRSKTISNGDDSSTRTYTTMGLAPWWDWSRARGPAAFDRPNRLSVMFNQELPKFFKSGFGKIVANNWAFSGLWIAQSGTPLSVTNTTSGQGLGGAATSVSAALYANVVADANLVNDGSNKSKLNNYINKAAWSKAPAGTVGNSGRGMLRGPGQNNFDLSIFRLFPIREKSKLEFRSEFFNIANHANFGNPTTNLDSASFGQITTTTVNARIVQFALKLKF